ncbi:A/G-specific adenine glycosylase [Chitinophaga sp. XS-30]|uniref:A/G-specific adenine glycosylase n=1 Tax=Chitinophaga sp. XS-30 TaxID=2604421 RepID=UPI0011DD595E|nr:A/G-specific adenine glycosylase [Chitinophaga sp. XS-30]QEH40289.1 A/G-specific adenine glycosylase [Chitinophaga sp. XS-30]
MTDTKRFFTDCLLTWNRLHNGRSMPWKGEKNPYKIWLSEIILQQTRVEQGWPYYERFIEKYPVVHLLAAAPEEEVFRLWQGLGYYARCKNMLAAAREIAGRFNGVFPSTYEGISSLKGIGAYTAAAIASFAFDLPFAVLDGNVYRVLARFFGIDTPTDSTAGKKLFTQLAGEVLAKDQSAVYNQAIMDFGAVVCKPRQPLCTTCPLSTRCEAYNKGLTDLVPVKSKKLVIKKRYFHYLLLEQQGRIYIRKRREKDIWQNLHEFVLLETPAPATDAELLQSPAFRRILGKHPYKVVHSSATIKQQLTHQTIHARFIRLSVTRAFPAPEGFLPVAPADLGQYAFPKIIVDFLQR